jgi:hypothetical protein
MAGADYTAAAETFGATFVDLADWALRWWVGDAGPGLEEIRREVLAVRPVGTWLAAAVAALAVVGSGLLLAVRRRGEDLAHVLFGLMRLGLAVSTGWLVAATAWTTSDRLAGWMVGPRAQAGGFTAGLEAALVAVEPGLAVTLSIVGAAACLGFVAVCVARFVAVCLLVVFLPVAAAASMLRPAPTLRIASGWAVSVLAFGPVTAMIYRVGHRVVDSAGDPLVVLLAGELSFLLAAASLPFIARMVGGLGPATGGR